MKRELEQGPHSPAKRASADIRSFFPSSQAPHSPRESASSAAADTRVWIATPLLCVVDYNVPGSSSFEALLSEFSALDFGRYPVGVCVVEDPSSSVWEDGELVAKMRQAQVEYPWLALCRGDITQPSTYDPPLNAQPLCLVNPCNKRFNEKGGLVNTRVHAAAGNALKKLAQEAYGIALTAECYAVDVPVDSQLHQRGFAQVFMVLCPNANPSRAHCLPPEEAAALTAQTYRNIVAQLKQYTDSKHALPFEFAMETRSQEEGTKEDTNKEEAKEQTKRQEEEHKVETGPAQFPAYHHPGPAVRTSSAAWKDVLFPYTRETGTASQAMIYFQDEHSVCIYDGYPKARIHLLMMAKASFLDVPSWTDVRTSEQLEKLRELVAKAESVASHLHARYQQEFGFSQIRNGCHAIPSLSPLHIHIISDDFDSEHLKNKKHWNSFTTEFFIPVDALLQRLEAGNRHVDTAKYEQLLKSDLHCHRCHQQLPTIPALKAHLRKCNHR